MEENGRLVRFIFHKGEAVPNRFTYYGQQIDPITQQYYLRTRFYDPVIGRFTQEDTYRGDGWTCMPIAIVIRLIIQIRVDSICRVWSTATILRLWTFCNLPHNSCKVYQENVSELFRQEKISTHGWS